MPRSTIQGRALKLSVGRFVGIALCMVTFSSQAADKVLVAFNTIPGLLEENNANAPYTLALTKLNAMLGNTMQFEYFPSSRASKTFYEHKSDCLFPASANTLHKDHEGPVIGSQPVNYAIAYVFSLNAFDLPKLINTSRPKYTISYRRGNSFGGHIAKLTQHNLFEVNSDEQSFGMLENDRVDFVITYMPDAKDLIKRPNGRDIFYNPQQAFHIQGDSLICHLNEKNKPFVEQINSALTLLKTSGALSKILGESYIQPQ